MLYAAEAKDIWQLTARERQSETEQKSNNNKNLTPFAYSNVLNEYERT